ncbi:MAG: Ig-like domain-containing protein [Erysipelotrichaceae bacterium]|nr:Ig-like domain-containing protein [Erysipelotrichaceae bacterium]
MYFKKGITGILSIMLAFSTMFSDTMTLHAEEAEPVETAVTETVEEPVEETAEQTEETVEETEPTEEVLPEETEEAAEETEETPEPEQEQTEEETALPAEETAEPETTETPAEETAEPEETEEPAAQYEVTFDAGDGHFEDGSTSLTVTVEEGTLLTEVPEVFADEELELVGWFLEGSGEPVDFTVFEVTESVTLTAVWAEKSAVTADESEKEITVEPSAYAAVIKLTSDSYVSTYNLRFVYSTDSTDTLLTDLETVTYSDLNKKTWFNVISRDDDYDDETGKYYYELHVNETNNKPLKPNTTYYVQTYQYSSGNYVRLGEKFEFTTTAGIEQTAVTIKDIQVLDGYAKSRVTFNLDNPNNEDIIQTILFVTQPDGTESTTTYYAYYSSYEGYYYADITNKWEAGYSVKIGVKVPEGNGELKRIESEALPLSPKDPSEITSSISSEVFVNSAVIKAEISPFYSWDSLSVYVYYRKKGETSYKTQYGSYSTYSNKPATATIRLTKLEPNTEYEYYKADQCYQNGTNVTLRSDGSADAPLTFKTKEQITYSESDFDPALYKELRSIFGLAEEENLTNANFEGITDLTIRLSLTQSSSYYSGSTYMTLYLKEPMKSLKGVDKFEVLTDLSAEGHDISDISPIQKMTGITNLDLDYNDFTAMPDLSGMTSLEYASLYSNLIDPNTVTADKFPASFKNVEDYINSYKQNQRNDELIIPDQFYDHADKKTAAVYYAGMKNGRSYTLTLTIDGKTADITYNNTSYNNNRVFLEEDAETAFGTTFDYDKDYSASFTIKDEFGTTYKEAVKNIRFVKDTRETEVSYVSSDSTNVYIYDIYLPEEFSSASITKAELINAAGTVLGTSESVNTRTSSTRYENRYGFPSTVTYSEATSYTYISSVRFNLIKRLRSGTYSVRLTTSDNRTLMINDCLVVYSLEDPAILDSIYQDSDYNSLGDYIFVELSGKNINPDKIWPVLYYGGKQATETTPAAHYYDGSTPVYKLKKTGDCWKEDSLNLEFKFEVQDGYEYISNITSSTINYYAGDSYKYDVYESWYNWKREQFEATAANPDKIVKVIAYNNSSDRSKDVNRIGETEEFTITEDCILAFNLKLDGELIKPVNRKYYYLKYFIKDGDYEDDSTDSVYVNYPADEVDTGNPYVQLSKYLYNTQVTSIDSILVGIPAETAVDTASMKFELTDQAGTVYGTSNSITAGTAVRNNINYNTYSVKNWTLTTPITEDGMYNIAFTDDKQPYVTTAITVLITDTFYMTYMYGSFSTNYSTNTTVFNLNLETPELNSAASAAAAKELWTDKKYKLEVFDALGTPVTGWSITGYSSRTLTISGLSTEYVGLYFRVTRNGVRPRDYQQVRQADGTYPEYYESEYGHYLNTGRSTVYTTGKGYSVYYGIGFGPEAVFPYTIRLYQKGTNQLFKSITVSNRSGLTNSVYRYFTKDDLKNVPENEYLDIKVVNQYEMCVYSTQGYLEPREVPSVPATSITLSAAGLTLNEGETAQLTATVKPANTTDIVVWTSSDASIASIDATGKVTAVSGGEATITARAGSKAVSIKVKVIGPVKVKGVDVTETLTLRPGKTSALKVTITPDDATNKKVTFESSDTAVATVDAEGNVTAVAEGTAVITVTTEDGSFKDECTVTVVGAEPAEAPKAYYYVNGALNELTADVKLSKGDQIVLKSATNGAAVYYTTDGSEPTAASTLYVEPIVFSGEGELQIRAFAVKEGYKDSEAFEIKVQVKSDSWADDPGDVTEEDAATVDYEIPKQIWFAGVPESVEYTGKKITIGTLRVYDHKTLLTTKDYKATYTNNLNAGTATVTVTGKGNYQKSVSQTFEIMPRNFAEAVADDLAVMETGKVLVPKPVVKYGSTTLKLYKDYTVAVKEEKELKEAGVYTLVLTGLVNYSGTKEIKYTIGAKGATTLMSKAKVTPEIKTVEYTGEAFQPSAIVKVGTAELIEGTDYDLTYRNNKEVGTATIVVTGKGSYAGVKTATFKITGVALSKAVTVTAVPQVYTGEELKTVVDTALIEGMDYEIAYTKNTNVGTATVTATGKGKYTGTVKKTFKITARNINETDISVSDTAEYAAKGAIPTVKVTYNGKTLKSGKDYTVTYKTNKAVGTATATIKGKGNFSGSADYTFYVEPKDIGKAVMTVNDVVENAKAGKWKSGVTVKDTDGGVIKAGAGYDKAVQYTYAEDVEVTNNKQSVFRMAGDAVDAKDIVPAGAVIKVTVNGIKNYTGSLSGTYKVIKAVENIAKATVTVAPQEYTGKAVTVAKKDITIKLNGTELAYGDYEIVSYTNNVKKGTATMVLRGTGNYGGTKTVKFKIDAKVMRYLNSALTL